MKTALSPRLEAIDSAMQLFKLRTALALSRMRARLEAASEIPTVTLIKSQLVYLSAPCHRRSYANAQRSLALSATNLSLQRTLLTLVVARSFLISRCTRRAHAAF